MMNIRHTLLLLSLLPSTAYAIDDNINDNFNIRGAVPTPSSINNNAPTPGALTPSMSDVHLRRLGKPCVCRPEKGQTCGCPPPTTPLAPTTPPPTCAPAPDLQCTNDDGGNTQCFYDTSFGACGTWRLCPNSCFYNDDPCGCPNHDRFRCTPETPVLSVLKDPPEGVTVNVPGSPFSCYDGYGGYYGGAGYCGTLAGGACCAKGWANANNVCHPVVTTTGTTSTTTTEATAATTTSSSTTTTTTGTTTTVAAQCAESGEYCRGKNAVYDTCCGSSTCGSGSDKTCS